MPIYAYISLYSAQAPGGAGSLLFDGRYLFTQYRGRTNHKRLRTVRQPDMF